MLGRISKGEIALENDLIDAQTTKCKGFVTKFDEPNLIPETQVVEEEFTPGICFLASTHMLRLACVRTHVCIHAKYIK